MSNIAQISAHGAIDTDGLSPDGLYIPASQQFGSLVGGALSSPDAASNQAVAPHLATAAQAAANAGTYSSGTSLAITLPAVANLLNYVTALHLTALAPASGADTFIVTLSGLTTPSLVYSLVVLNALVPPSLIVNFNVPIPASAVNSPITLTATLFGGGSLTSGQLRMVIVGFVL